MIRIKRYIKYQGELIGPGKELALSPELEEKHVNSGAAEYIMAKALDAKKVVESKKAEGEEPKAEKTENPYEIEQESELPTNIATESEGGNDDSDGAGNEEEADVGDLVPEDVKINFDEEEYASGSKKKRKK